MQKILKYIGLTFLSALIVLYLCYLAFMYYISSESLRSDLSNRISAATGYRVQLHQSPHISFFPQLKASLDYVILQNNRADFLRADKIEIDFSFWKALKGIISVSDIQIIKPEIFLYNPINDFFSIMQHSFIPKKSLHTIIIKDGVLHYSLHKEDKIDKLNGVIFLGRKEQSSYINLQGNILNKKFNFVSNTAYDADKKILQLNNINVTLDNQEMHGAVQIITKPVTKLVGSLALNSMDVKSNLNYLLNKLFQHNDNALNIDIRLSANIVKYENFIINNLATTIQLDKKGLILSIGSAQTKIGAINAILKIIRAKGSVDFLTNIEMLAKDVDYKALCSKFKLPIKIKGKANLNIKIQQKLKAEQINKLYKILATNGEIYNNIQKIPLKINISLNKGQIASYNIKQALDIAENHKIKHKIRHHKFVEIIAPYEIDIDNFNNNYIDFKNVKLTLDCSNKENIRLWGEGWFANKEHNFNSTIKPDSFILYGTAKGDNNIDYWLFKQNKTHIIAMQHAKVNNLCSKKLLSNLLNKYKVK